MQINNIYKAVYPRSSWSGHFLTHIELGGCNLIDYPNGMGSNGCYWCRTPHVRNPKKKYTEMSPEEVIIEVNKKGLTGIAITGGEPLIQKKIWYLISGLLEKGYFIIMETNGATLIKRNLKDYGFKPLIIIMEILLPGSGMFKHSLLEQNLPYLRSDVDEVNFTIVNELDYVIARKLIIDLHIWDFIRKLNFSAQNKIIDSFIKKELLNDVGKIFKYPAKYRMEV